MFAITRSFVRSPALRHGLQSLQIAGAVRPVSIKIVPAVTKTETFLEKNDRLKREMSPHLTIYKPQLTSMLSITFRATGCALAVYAWAFGIGALVSPHDVSHYVTMIEGLELSGATLAVMKAVLAFPVAYHFANGIRHLIWDTGKFLKIKEVYATGYVMVLASLILTGVLASL